ncbi:MAG: hypothetical protein IJF74_07255 [Clostridia bacterium]|nr:hypothetical protein [Clostridia bacterium]
MNTAKTFRKNTVKAVCAVLLCAMLICALPVFVSAGEFTSTVNLLDVRKNQRGDGYEWDNRNDILTLTNFTVNTKDRYGLRIPSGATVVLVGTNTITASYAALDIEGEAYFRGEGTLILNGGEVGFINPFNMDDKKVIIESGTYIINSEGVGISSPYATFSQTGGKIEINCKGEAVSGREIRLGGGTFKANNSVHATNKLTVSYTTLDISSPKAALISDKTLSVNGVKLISDGNTLDEYKGESSLKTSPLSKARTTSMLFELMGMKSVPIAIDYVIFAVCILAVAAIIVVPKLIKKKKLRAALERYEAENAAKKAEKGKK